MSSTPGQANGRGGTSQGGRESGRSADGGLWPANAQARRRGGGPLSLYQRLDLEKDIGIAVVRSFLQLAAIGYVIDYVFGLDNLGVVALLLAGMVLFAAWTSARRATNVSDAFPIAAVAVGVAAVATLVLLLALGIVPATARYLIPLGGMVIGNSMNAASLTMIRIRDDLAEQT